MRFKTFMETSKNALSFKVEGKINLDRCKSLFDMVYHFTDFIETFTGEIEEQIEELPIYKQKVKTKTLKKYLLKFNYLNTAENILLKSLDVASNGKKNLSIEKFMHSLMNTEGYSDMSLPILEIVLAALNEIEKKGGVK